MEQTANYGLNLWEKADRIMMEDFNADNAKIDAALTAQAEQLVPITEQIGKLGNCQLYTTTYTGDGKVATKTLTFPAKPIVIMVSTVDGRYRSIFWQGMSYAPMMYQYLYPMALTWSGNSVSWYYEGNAEGNFTASNTAYYVIALLDMA